MRLLAGQIPERTVRQAVEAVFRSPAYNRTTLLGRFGAWLWEMFLRFLDWLRPPIDRMHGSVVLYWGVIIAVGALAAASIARMIYLSARRRVRTAAGAGWEQVSGVPRGDAWAAAQLLAAQGNYTAAAHALYAALLDAGARQQLLRLHPSKTVGDYVREIRRRSSPLLAGFRDFARAYEFVIYGVGDCNRERYERLHALALPIVRPNG